MLEDCFFELLCTGNGERLDDNAHELDQLPILRKTGYDLSAL